MDLFKDFAVGFTGGFVVYVREANAAYAECAAFGLLDMLFCKAGAALRQIECVNIEFLRLRRCRRS